MKFQITVRFGRPALRYHTETVEADGLADALQQARKMVPTEVLDTGDLVEIRPAVDPESERPYTEGQPVEPD